MRSTFAARRLARLAAAVVLLLAAACGDGPSGTRSNPTPGVAGIAPQSVEQGGDAFTLTVQGTDFVASSVVRWNGADRPTTFVSATQLTAAIPAADLAQAGAVQVSVFNPAPGGGVSNPAALEVDVRANRLPLVDSLGPDTMIIHVGGQLTVYGANFVPTSLVWLDSGPATTTYVSPTELRAVGTPQHVAVARTLGVWVQSPPPGGGDSPRRTLYVVNPAPVAASLSPAAAPAGQDSLVVRVTGSGFMPAGPFGTGEGSVVSFQGAARPTRFVSATELAVTLSAEDVAESGSYGITVTTPAPGGGTTAPLTLELARAVPVLTLLPSYGASAGRPGFPLLVHGVGFVPQSVVRIGGEARTTRYLGPTRLETVLAAADVAAPGALQVSVHTPAPGGGTSGTATLTVRAVPAATVSSTRALSFAAADIVYDPTSQRLYATARTEAPTHQSHLVAIDPNTGLVADSVVLSGGPEHLALSDDGVALWASVNGAREVVRVGLPALNPGLRFSVDAEHRVEELRAMPGSARSVAASLRNVCCSPRHEGVAVYDEGVRRARMTQDHTGANSIDFGESGSVLYGYNNETSEFGFRTIAVTAEGVRQGRVTGALFHDYEIRIRYASGRVYGTDGGVVDASRHVRVGSFAAGGVSVLPDPVLGRVFILSGGVIRVYDMNTFQLLGTITVPGVTGGTRALVRWGTDGLAFANERVVRIIRTPLAGGAAPSAYRRR